MKWYFLIVGICGAPFTAGWSLLLGVVAFAVVGAGQSVRDETSARMSQSATPIGVLGWAIVGVLAIVGLMAIFGAALVGALEGLEGL